MCDHCGCLDIPAIAELDAEHEEILERAWAVVQAHRTETAARAVEALLEVLDPHVAKEEAALYPLLVDTGDIDRETRAAFEAEHVEIRRVLLAGEFDRGAYYALAAHAEAEANEMFPLALFGFDDQDWEGMQAVHRAVGHR